MAWYLFPDSTLSNLELSDCNDTINGICENTKTLGECIKKCDNDACKYGYFIKGSKRNYCVPLLNYSEDSPIYYRLRNKNIYPELRHLESTVFANKKIPYPPNLANTMFYFDNFVLNIPKLNLVLVDDTNVKFDTVNAENGLQIRLVPEQIKRSYVSNYIIVKVGDIININIPSSALLLHNDGKLFSWTSESNTVELTKLTINALNKDVGESLDYTDSIYFTINSFPVNYNAETDNLEILSISTENMLADITSYNTIFKFIPFVTVNYCSKTGCNSIPLYKTTQNGPSASFQGVSAERSPVCWNQCTTKKSDRTVIVIVVITVFILIIGLFLFFRKRKTVIEY
jgi:hypothetical protein